MRKVFFSFKYKDVWRANQVRNSWVTKGNYTLAGFVDSADIEQVKRSTDQAIEDWINDQLHGTSVTVVLVGQHTCNSRWVDHEIEESIKKENGLLGIDISEIKDSHGNTSGRCGKIPRGYPFYSWNNDDGYKNLGDWIETAAQQAGR